MQTFLRVAPATSLALFLLLGARVAAAQETPRTGVRLGIDLLTASVDEAAANEAGTGERMWGAQVNVGFNPLQFVTLRGDFGIVGVKDERAFSQETTGGERTSGVASGMATLAAGLRTPPLALGGAKPFSASAGVNVGHTFLNTTRTISQCIDCHGESVKIQAGSFWEPGVEVTRGRGGISARYRVYTGEADLRNALMIGYTTAIRVPGRAKAAETPPPAPPAEPTSGERQ